MVALRGYAAELRGDESGEGSYGPSGTRSPTRASWSVRAEPSARYSVRPVSSVPAGARSGASWGSCSSWTSPTTSSTMSSSVTTPAVPPYSSMTTAMVFFPESRSSSLSTVRDSGTKSGSRITRATEQCCRFSAGTATTSLMCAIPTTVSRFPR